LRLTYGKPLKVWLRLNRQQPLEEEVFLGDIPIMLGGGEFIINGAERVVVSQLHRSPGVDFVEESEGTSDRKLPSARVIPERGSWIEINVTKKDSLQVRIDQSGKFSVITLLRAMSPKFSTNTDMLSVFYEVKSEKISDGRSLAKIENKIACDDVVFPSDHERAGEIIVEAGHKITKAIGDVICTCGVKSVEVMDAPKVPYLLNSMAEDNTASHEEALLRIYQRLRPGNPPALEKAKQLFHEKFFDINRYRLGRVGRFRVNRKLGLAVPEDEMALRPEDLIASIKYLIDLFDQDSSARFDDIDHLGNRRLRTIDELACEELRKGFLKLRRTVQERMSVKDVQDMTPRTLVNQKSISAAIEYFFGRGELSQVVDQTNPLSQLTHERRLSALGPGGLNRKRAGFEVRDVHISHYGRICPIETPEGTNIGLISSLSTYARVNDFGFIETPYRKVVNGKVTDEIEYLTGDRDENFYVAQANSPVDSKGKFLGETVSSRFRGDFVEIEPEKVQYMDVSPKQLVSVAAGLIPFLEHDDANRALMGSNMQRQGVPLLISDAPIIGTGMEGRVARDSRAVIVADSNGKIASVDAQRIIVTKDGELPEGKKKIKSDPESGVYVYELRKFMRSNSSTCINQKPIVRKGQTVKKGDVLADGPNTENGELALGRNVLVAFMPWNGYNFEDAILISERVVKEDIYTSIHIDEFECGARDTKLGPEEITRDIPNVSEEALQNLGPDGVIRIGAEVKPGDILVGKITPKSETELAPEERLLRAIFGEKAADVKDTSLLVPSGTYGIVMDVRVSSKEKATKIKMTPAESKRQQKMIQDDHKKRKDELFEQLTEGLANVLLGEKIPLDVVNGETGEIIIPANRKITKMLLRKLAGVYNVVEIDPSPIRNKIREIIGQFEHRFADLENEKEENLGRVESGDDVDPGIIKQVKVFIASKRKLSVGDKMAGRHGNKGVVAKIVPEEDMPFLSDGTPVDIVLNPLGVPSRMNVGQVLETHLGVAAKALGFKVATPVFDGIPETRIREYLKEAGQKEGFSWIQENGKSQLFDGRTGEAFDQEVVVGIIYMLKLGHLVADKIHARAVGPYSLVTQQPLGGKAQYGGQRFGEMEVWALEAYGAAYTLQELLTVKSDDVQGRTRIYESIVKGDNSLEAGIPESFNVLIKEMQGLGLDVRVGGKDEPRSFIDTAASL
jgi:DNA-directed RNA polymerase subunit beta